MFKNTWLADVVHLIYPEVCAACGRHLQKEEEVLCLHCEHNLPYTSFHMDADNPIAKNFWGRVPITHASSLCVFSKGDRVQQLIHQLKYEGRTDIGLHLGKIAGQILREVEGFKEVEMVIPVPLHPQRKRERGYNQSDFFAEGIAQSLDVDWTSEVLVRNLYSATQTKKTRFNRWKNVEEIFLLKQATKINNKHVLLVDDVITTGATLEACANELLKAENVSISVMSIACAL